MDGRGAGRGCPGQRPRPTATEPRAGPTTSGGPDSETLAASQVACSLPPNAVDRPGRAVYSLPLDTSSCMHVPYLDSFRDVSSLNAGQGRVARGRTPDY